MFGMEVLNIRNKSIGTKKVNCKSPNMFFNPQNGQSRRECEL